MSESQRDYWIIMEQCSKADRALEALENSYPQGSKIARVIERMRGKLARIILADTDSQADIEADKLEKWFVSPVNCRKKITARKTIR